VFVWEAIKICRFARKPLPEWVLEYLGTVADAMSRLVDDPPERPTAAIAQALSTDTKGAGNVFTKARKRGGPQ
jgi:hypothetical protein